MKRTPAVSLVLALLCVLPVNAEDYYNETALPDGSRIVCTEHQMIPAPYHTAYRFDKYGVLAPDGTFLVEPIYQSIAAPVEGRALFFKAGEGYGYFDENWNVVIPAQYNFAQSFSEGLAAVSDEQQRVGYIDRNGSTADDFYYPLLFYRDIVYLPVLYREGMERLNIRYSYHLGEGDTTPGYMVFTHN